MAQNQHKSQRDQDALMSVHQQTIWKQRVKKELDHLVLNTTFHINPYKLPSVVATKPNSLQPYDIDHEGDDYLHRIVEQSRKPPTERFTYPQTSSQEYGWISTPLLKQDKQDRRLYHGRQCTEVTKLKELELRQQATSEHMSLEKK